VSIKLQCKSGDISYPFNKNITALYGNIGVGKTSLMNLVSFCLGNDLVRTLAIDEQLLSCTLDTEYCGAFMSFTRKVSSNFITVKTKDSDIQLRVKDGYPECTISDYLYDLEGIQPLFWMPTKSTSTHKKNRITFPNFYWFAYLKQDEIDNSLFYFKDSQNYYKEIASRNVLYSCLGGNSQSRTEFQDRIRNLSKAHDEITKKILFSNEIRDTTSLFTKDLSSEIVKKKREVLALKTTLDRFLPENSQLTVDINLNELLAIKYKIGLFEAELQYLAAFNKVKSVLDSQLIAKQQIENNIDNIKLDHSYKNIGSNSLFEENLQTLNTLFQETLTRVGFPGMDAGDSIKLHPKDFSPILYSYGGRKKADFYTLSSGGKKTIYKICYGIAIHRLIKKNNLRTLIPQILVIDTPMKNISEREDAALYNSLFEVLYDLFRQGGELEDVQLILVDKELHPYFNKNNITAYHLTNEKPLIPFYRI